LKSSRSIILIYFSKNELRFDWLSQLDILPGKQENRCFAQEDHLSGQIGDFPVTGSVAAETFVGGGF
jgi:hypothetical protein